MIQFEVSAPGKIILYGDHAVVYGKTAVAASLDMRTVLEFEELPADQQNIQLSMPKIGLLMNVAVQRIRDFFHGDNSPNLDENSDVLYERTREFVENVGYHNDLQKLGLEVLFYLLIAISRDAKVEVKPFRMHLDTELSISAGLGSSASFSVCIAASLVHWSRLRNNLTTTLDTAQLEAISKLALRSEKIMHGTPSGIDNSICTFGSIIEFRRDGCLKPIANAKSLRVLLVNTKVRRSTKDFVDRVAKLREKYPTIFEPILNSVDSVSREALNVLRKLRDLPETYDESHRELYQELMTLVKVNQGLLSALHVSHSSLDKICSVAKDYGLEGKLTGAGGGGYAYILLLPDTPDDVIKGISDKLSADDFIVTLTQLGGPGLRIES